MSTNREPQSDNWQRRRDLGTLIPQRDVSINSLPSGFREPWWRAGQRGWRILRKQILNSKTNSQRLRQHAQVDIRWSPRDEERSTCPTPLSQCHVRASLTVSFLFLIFIPAPLYPTGPLCIHCFQFVFYGIPECMNGWVCVYFCFLCLILGSFLSVLFYSNVFVFVLSYLILFYHRPLEACLFSSERQKGGTSSSEGLWGGIMRRKKGNQNQDTLYEKIYF